MRESIQLVEEAGIGHGHGFGAVWDRPRDFSARLSVAFPLSGEAINDTKKSPRIYFLANKTF